MDRKEAGAVPEEVGEGESPGSTHSFSNTGNHGLRSLEDQHSRKHLP